MVLKALATYQPSASPAPNSRRPAGFGKPHGHQGLRCLSAVSLYGPSSNETIGFYRTHCPDATLLVSRRPIWPQLRHSLWLQLTSHTSKPCCLSAICLSGPKFSAALKTLASCLPNAYAVPAPRQKLALTKHTTLLAPLIVSLRTLRS